MTTNGFEIGKRYKTRDGEKTATLLTIGKTGLVFENAGGMYLREFSGRYDASEDTDFDFLPIEVREPRKVEGIVWVNEYENHTTYLSSLEMLFGHELAIFGSKEVCKKLHVHKPTRVAVKYKVTFEEVTEEIEDDK
jgi:hypothetical protein